MKSQINKILADINKKKQELLLEYTKLKQKYGFSIIWRKIIFNKDTKKINKTYKKSILDSILWARIMEILSAPFIYTMIIPAIILDIFLFIFQNTYFRLCWVPLVKRHDYIEYDRRKLDYLNVIQKINCLFCSYVNWLFSYAVEIAWRAERYWCPIKHAKRINWWHDWEPDFADYW